MKKYMLLKVAQALREIKYIFGGKFCLEVEK